MERKDFISSDPLTNNIVTFMRNNPNNAFTPEDMVQNIRGTVSSKQIQLVMSLLMREGMVKVTTSGGRTAYQIK
jgi:hypothetical protein